MCLMLPRGYPCQIPALCYAEEGEEGAAGERDFWVSTRGWDFTSILTPVQQADGWHLYVRKGRRIARKYIALLTRAGLIHGMAYVLCRDSYMETHAYPLEKIWRGQGFGRAMYEAMLGLAGRNKHLHTVRSKVGGCSDAAHLVHLRLIQKYKCVRVKMKEWRKRGYEYTFPVVRKGRKR